MRVILGILWVFMQAALGSLIQDPVVCRLTVSNQCYVALGQRLHLQLPLQEDGFNFHIIDKTSNAHLILKYIKTQSAPPTPNFPRWQFDNENKTMILTSAQRSDSGTYTLLTFNGNNKSKHFLQLNIEAQVSSVKASYSCLSPGVMKVFCSADGDNLRFNWTSHFITLPELETGTSALILDKNHQRKVTCHVENHVSRDHNTTELLPCLGIFVFVSVWLLEIILLLSLLVGAFYIYTRIYRQLDKGNFNTDISMKHMC